MSTSSVIPSFRRSKPLDSAEADFGERMRSSLLGGVADSVVADGDLAATTNVQQIPHGLGRAYRGAIVVAQGSITAIAVLMPENADDPTRRVAVRQSGAVAQALRLVVF